jgi:hypothetical protein
MLAIAAPVWAEPAVWPPEALVFFEPLTYPSSAWKADDFGQETPVADRVLLERFQPRVFIAPKGIPPIDFYQDYLPQTVVRNSMKHIVRAAPDRTYLKQIERDPRFYLDFQGNIAPCRGAGCRNHHAVMYGRLYRETMNTPLGYEPARAIEVMVLKYNVAFAASGLPAGLAWYQGEVARMIGDLDIWHELDIHGAVHLLIKPGEERPFAVVLAQHNHFRTYLVGRDLTWPADGHLPVCYSDRSNEPYLCPNGSQPAYHRAVGNPRHIHYLVLGGRAPLTGGEDAVYGADSGAAEVICRLEFLPDRDPLYVSWIPLGDKLRVFGVWENFYRTGPPGMDMNTWPDLKKYSDITQFWYVQDGDEELVRVFEHAIKGFDDANLTPVLSYNGARLWRDLESTGRF